MLKDILPKGNTRIPKVFWSDIYVMCLNCNFYRFWNKQRDDPDETKIIKLLCYECKKKMKIIIPKYEYYDINGNLLSISEYVC